MNEKGLMEQSNAAIKAALELYAADHGKLNDGDSFTTKLNNCVLTISLKDGSLDVQFDPDADVAVDTPYTLDMKLDIYKEEDNCSKNLMCGQYPQKKLWAMQKRTLEFRDL